MVLVTEEGRLVSGMSRGFGMSRTAKRPRVVLFATPLSVGHLGLLFPVSRLRLGDPTRSRLISSDVVCVAARSRARAAKVDGRDAAKRTKKPGKSIIRLEVGQASLDGSRSSASAEGGDDGKNPKASTVKVVARRRLSEETKRKIAETMMGKPKSVEALALLTLWMRYAKL